MIKIEGATVNFETKTLSAIIKNGCLTELKSKRGETFISCGDAGNGGCGGGGSGGGGGGSGGGGTGGGVQSIGSGVFQLVYPHGETSDLHMRSSVYVQKLNDYSAFICVDGWYGEGVIKVEEDIPTGDLLISPSVTTRREGLRACRYILKGIREDLRIVAPIYQGINMRQDDPLLVKQRFGWPWHWEAGLVIMQGRESGFWVHTQDSKYRFKALSVGVNGELNTLGFDTEAYGPVEHNKCAGGLTWRINVFDGGWHTPADIYSGWLFKAYNLNSAMASRPDWLKKLGLAVSWCPCDPDILDALAKKSDPSRILLHVPGWRQDAYDQNYPRYVESDAGAAFIMKATEMGFHAMPHMNAHHIDPTHEDYYKVQGFELPDIESRNIMGWVWDKELGCFDMPKGATAYISNRALNTMIAIHAGLTKWRALLTQNLKAALDRLGLDLVFIDQTLCTFNSYNSLIENTTFTEGMNILIHQVAAINGGIAVGGEGLNEIMFQGLSVAQAHLFNSHQQNAEGLERTGGCNLNSYIFKGLCRLFGYTWLDGKTEESRLRMRIHSEHDWIPTITVRSADDILNPNQTVKEMLEACN